MGRKDKKPPKQGGDTGGKDKKPSPLEVGFVSYPSLPAAPGREQMFGELYVKLWPIGLNHARQFLASEADAQDVVLEALGQLYLIWPELPLEKRNIRYCIGTIHKHILEFRRERRKHRMVVLDFAAALFNRLAIQRIDRPTRHTTALDVIDLAIAGMPPQRRSVLLLHIEGLEDEEIQEQLSIAKGTVNRHRDLAAKDIRAAFVRAGIRLAGSRTPQLASGAPVVTEGVSDV